MNNPRLFTSATIDADEEKALARADLTLELAKAALSSDKPGIVRALQTLSVEEKRLNHHSVADRIENLLSGSHSRLSNYPKTVSL